MAFNSPVGKCSLARVSSGRFFIAPVRDHTRSRYETNEFGLFRGLWAFGAVPTTSACFRPPWSTASRSTHATLARRRGAGWVISEGGSRPSRRAKQPELPKGPPRRTMTCQANEIKNTARAFSTPARLAACPARARSRTQPQNAHYGSNEPGQMVAAIIYGPHPVRV